MALYNMGPAEWNLCVGNDYRLMKSVTALAQDSGEPVLCKMPAFSIVTVAAVVRGSCFVEVTCDGKLYELFADDLEQWSRPC